MVFGLILLVGLFHINYCHYLRNNSLERDSIGMNQFCISTFEEDLNQQSTGLQILYPTTGDILKGKVTIRWTITSPYSLSEVKSFSIYYSSDSYTNWIQIAYEIVDTFFVWDTNLYEEYGTNFKINISATSNEWDSDISTVSEGTFSIDNRLSSNFPVYLYILIPLLLTLGVVVSLVFYRFKSRTDYIIDLQNIEQESMIKTLNHKIIIGLDNVKTDFKHLGIDLSLGENIHPENGSIIHYFPTSFQSELKSEIKGRTVMVLIEIAYQNPINTNPVKIAEGIGIPLSTTSKEIKKLVRLNYIEDHISNQVLLDARYRNFRLTTKGFEFLNILNTVLKNTLNQFQERNLA